MFANDMICVVLVVVAESSHLDVRGCVVLQSPLVHLSGLFGYDLWQISAHRTQRELSRALCWVGELKALSGASFARQSHRE